MEQNSRNSEFLNKVYKNAKMGGESVRYVSEKANDPALLSDLQCQHKAYTDLQNRAAEALAETCEMPKEQSPVAQAAIWSGVQMNTMLDKSPDKIAEMMIQGSMMGVIDMTRTLGRYGDMPANLKKIGEDLVKLEENSIQKMKQYLS